ncbi:hypothetical protein FHT02_004322 [Sphingomonas xinjiangensis]|uniref:Uncharacterized protein n=1 Tax=Sphingomonas xinjiangensis TaxID=643568 RepID=A0A840YTQ6_9SPHN|nr:hypothetical protein [Sphingomonas xinjiangensis]
MAKVVYPHALKADFATQIAPKPIEPDRLILARSDCGTNSGKLVSLSARIHMKGFAEGI